MRAEVIWSEPEVRLSSALSSPPRSVVRRSLIAAASPSVSFSRSEDTETQKAARS